MALTIYVLSVSSRSSDSAPPQRSPLLVPSPPTECSLFFQPMRRNHAARALHRRRRERKRRHETSGVRALSGAASGRSGSARLPSCEGAAGSARSALRPAVARAEANRLGVKLWNCSVLSRFDTGVSAGLAVYLNLLGWKTCANVQHTHRDTS